MTLEPGLRFIGIDLAWSPRNASGVAALAPADGGLAVLACDRVVSDDAIAAFVAAHRGTGTVVMVDAPLRVPNEAGNRACERELNRAFARFQAGAHPSNRRNQLRDGVIRGEALARRLAALGVREATLAEAGRGHTMYECYPHAAHVVLFGLARTLKYKKERQPWAEAHAAFETLLAHLQALAEPRLVLDAALLAALAPAGSRGQGYKAREDRADAILCAYLGALAVLGRMEMLGTVEEGHIVVPRSGQAI
ncbi:MAG TPA: DUF429 domain-containing protein [Gemmatimonadales bacterium]|nr:DUF429 domain-containing protein [Gemmatimonadales bacterium]